MKNRIVTYPIFFLLFIVWLVPAHAARPPQAAIASAHPLATQAGHDILNAGGNAFDAAIAVTAALAVVEPYSSGIGGGGFWLLHRASDGLDVMVDGREKAPLAAHRDMYLDEKGEIIPQLSINGPLAAGIPGVPAAIVHLVDKYGNLSLKQSLAPSIQLARQGFAIEEHYTRLAKFRLETIRQSPDASRIFLQDNEIPEPGFILKQPDLASTLEAIANKGKDGFYSGPVAKKLVDGVREAGGIWTRQDLSGYHIVEREPVRSQYRNIKVISAAPPSSGGVALATMLNILDGYNLDSLEKVTRTHLIVEAMRRAYRDRAEYLGDPDFVDIPIKRLTHPYYAKGLASTIRLDQSTPSSSLPGIASNSAGTDTTHFSVLDREGNRVAATLSINYPFGSGFVPEGTGVLLNDEMDDFSAKKGIPNVYGLIGDTANAIAPGKRPLSSMTPTFLETDDKVAILGTPGGSRIITMVLLGALDFAAGNDPASWVSVKRFHHQYQPDVIQHEPDTFSTDEINALEQLGHQLKNKNRQYGNMQAILWDKKQNKVMAASDPRRSGQATVK